MELYNHLYNNLQASFVEWPKETVNKNILHQYGLQLEISDRDLVHVVLVFLFLPVFFYVFTVQMATLYFKNHKSKDMREHVSTIIKNGSFYECCQRFVRAFYGAYFAYYNILNWYYTTSLENSIYHCLAYSLFHAADLVILFLYGSTSYDMYFHHVCVSGFTFVTFKYIRKAHYLLHICSSFDLTVVFSTIIFLCRSFGHTVNYLYFTCVMISNFIFIGFRMPFTWFLVLNCWRFGLDALFCSMGPFFIIFLDIKWTRSLLRITKNTWQALQKTKKL